MPKITQTVVDAASGKDSFIWDDEVPGFGVRVQEARKTFVIRYRNAHGTQRKMMIGRCCDITPTEARNKARKLFAQVADGKDPARERQEVRTAPTIQELRDRYQREWATPFKKPRSAKEDEGTWRRYILPVWARRKVAEITRADVLKLQGDLVDTPAAANAVLALLGKAFNLAEEWSWRPQNSNPVSKVRKYKLKSKQLFLTIDGIGAVDGAVDDLVVESSITFAMGALARLWIVTGCRNSEIRTAERAWVNLEQQALALPDSKVGQRLIPLPKIALQIVQELDAVYGKDRRWLIPGRKTNECLKSPWKAWKRIAARAGIPEESTPHTLRHSVGSNGHAGGLSQKQVQGQLGHKQMATSEIYIHGSEQAQTAERVAEIMTAKWRARVIPDAAAQA